MTQRMQSTFFLLIAILMPNLSSVYGVNVTADTISPSHGKATTAFAQSLKTNKDLTVAGNVVDNGKLTVAKATTLNDSLVVKGNFTVNTDKFSVDATTGNTIIGGTLQTMAIAASQGLSMQALQAGQPVRVLTPKGVISTGPAPDSLSWSPDGYYLAVVSSGNLTIQTFRVNSLGVMAAINSQPTGANPRSVAWSPAGNFIAVVNDVDGTVEIFGVSAKGKLSAVISTQTTQSFPSSVTWSPAGNLIAVTSSQSDSIQIFNVDPTGMLSAEITTQPTGNNPTSVTWSPDGKFIAVTNFQGNTVQIFWIDTIGKLSTVVSSQPTGINPISAIWSPDNKFIAVVNFQNNTVQTFGVDTLGHLSEEISSQTTGINPSSVTWSAQGDFIAVANRQSNNIQIFGVDPAGKLSDLVATQATENGPLAVSWSPVDDFIAVTNILGNSSQIFRGNFSKYQVTTTPDGVSLNDNTVVGGMFNVRGPAVLGNKRIFGEKSIPVLGTSLTNVLALEFDTMQTGSLSPIPNGAHVKIDCFIAGTNAETPSLNYFAGDYYIDPVIGASPLFVINEQIHKQHGTAAVVVSGASVADNIVNLKLSCTPDMAADQSVLIFYEIISDNVASVS